MKKKVLILGQIILNIIYSILKLLPVTKKVVMISRQTNEEVIDFELLKKEFEIQNYKVVILCKKIEGNILKKIVYAFHILKMMYHIATSKICVVDTYCICVSMLKHKKHLKIIQVWHAMGAIKKFGYQSVGKQEGRSKEISDLLNMHKNYTYITCTSSVTREFYSEAFNTDIEKIKVWGMPRVDYINEIVNSEVRKNSKEKETILYVPTFRKNQKVQMDELINSIDLEKYNLIIRLHPLDDTSIDEKFKIDSKFDIYQCIKMADYIITDYSAIAIEASIFSKPIFFYLYDIDGYIQNRGLNVDLYTELPDFVCRTSQEIIKKIETSNFDMAQMENFKNKYVETLQINNTKNIVNNLLGVEK